MRRVIVDAKLPLDDAGYADGGPYCAAEAEGLRPPLQQVGQVGNLLGRQLGLGAGRGMAAQGLDALGSGTRQPLADRPRRHTQRGGDSALLPALLVKLPRPEPTTFFPVVGLELFCLYHTTRCSTSHTIVSYLCRGQ